MITWTLLTMMALLNFMLPMLFHPLSFTLIIILQTIISCSIMGSTSYSFWFSYIMILIFLGGMLVLFIYITSLASNEMFSMPSKTMLIWSSGLLIFSMMMFLIMHDMLSLMPTKHDSISMNQFFNLMESPMNLNSLYNYPNSILTILTIIYLLITMIIVVKITQIQEGPLRQSN